MSDVRYHGVVLRRLHSTIFRLLADSCSLVLVQIQAACPNALRATTFRGVAEVLSKGNRNDTCYALAIPNRSYSYCLPSGGASSLAAESTILPNHVRESELDQFQWIMR